MASTGAAAGGGGIDRDGLEAAVAPTGVTAGDPLSAVAAALASVCAAGAPTWLGAPGGSIALGYELKRLRQRVETAGLRWPTDRPLGVNRGESGDGGV